MNLAEVKKWVFGGVGSAIGGGIAAAMCSMHLIQQIQLSKDFGFLVSCGLFFLMRIRFNTWWLRSSLTVGNENDDYVSIKSGRIKAESVRYSESEERS